MHNLHRKIGPFVPLYPSPRLNDIRTTFHLPLSSPPFSMASAPSPPVSGAEERFDKAKKHLWQVEALSPLLSVRRLGQRCMRCCDNASSLHFKRQLRCFCFLGFSRLRCAYAPHVLANGFLIIMQYPHRASESPTLRENHVDRPAERREPGMKSPSPEYIRMRSNHSATPDRPRSLQSTEKPPECTFKRSSKFVSFFCTVYY